MPNPESTWLRFLRKGAEKLRVGDHATALRYFARAYDLAPHEPLVCFALGRERMRQGRLQDALRLLTYAWEQDPSFSPTGLTLARLLGIHFQDRDAARRVLSRVEANGDVAWEAVRLVEAEILLRSEASPAQALQIFRRVVEEGRPEYEGPAREGLARAYNAMGLELVEAGRHDEALFAFKRAALEDPEWAAPHVNLGAVFQKLGNARRARQEFRRALALEPDNPSAMYNLAELAAESGNVRTAVRYYRKLLQFHPQFPGVRAALARMLFRRDRRVPKRPLH